MLKLIRGVVNSGKSMVLIHYIAETLANTDYPICVFLEEYPLEKFKNRLDIYLKFRGIEMDRIIGIEDISDCEARTVLAKLHDKQDSVVFVDSWNSATTGLYSEFMEIAKARTMPTYICEQVASKHEKDLIANASVIDNIVVWKDGDAIMVKNPFLPSTFRLEFSQFFIKHHVCSVETVIGDEHIDNPEDGIKLLSVDVEDGHNFNFVSTEKDHEYLNKFIGRKIRISIETID